MFSLTDNAALTGTSRYELENALIDLVKHTGFTDPVYPADLDLLAVDQIFGQSIKCIPARGKSRVTIDGHDHLRTLVSFSNFRSMDPDLFLETISHGVLIGCPPWYGPVPLSSHAVDDLLSMVSLNGKGTASHSFEVLALLNRCLENDLNSYVITVVEQNDAGNISKFNYRCDSAAKRLKDSRGRIRNFYLRFMYRWDDLGNIKVFSAISSRYGEIPQTKVLDVLDRLLIFGKPEVRDWTIDHFKTCVNVDFPEIAEDYAETYGLSYSVMPGIRIVTSDSRDASFFVEGTMSIGGSDALPMEADQARISRRHFGDGDIDPILQRVNLDILPLYRQYPEKLCELLSITEEIPVRRCLEAAFRAMNLRARSMEISVRTEAEIVDILTSASSAKTMPVYDAVFLALNAHKSEDLHLSENQREHLKAHALRAVLITDEYKQIIEEEKTCLNSFGATTSASLQAVS